MKEQKMITIETSDCCKYCLCFEKNIFVKISLHALILNQICSLTYNLNKSLCTKQNKTKYVIFKSIKHYTI